jgi:hypothetical protein
VKVLVIPDPTLTRAWPGHEDAPELVVHPLEDALTRAWQSDAHFTAYHAPARARRLSGTSPSGRAVWSIGEIPRMALLVVDVDHEDTHAANKRRKAAGQSKLTVPDAWRAAERAKVDALRAAHPGVVMYDTRGGYRLVARLACDHAIDSDASKRSWRCWYLRQLGYLSRAFGIVGDPSCDDWTRLYRLPRATRDPRGTPEDLPLVGDPQAVGAWDRAEDEADVHELVRLAALHPAPHRWASSARLVSPAPAPPPKGPRPPRAPRSSVVDATVCPLVPPGPLAAALARSLDELPRRTGARHAARLAIVGALRREGWSAPLLERLVRELAGAMGKDPHALVAELVPSTILRVDHGAAAMGEGHLRDHAPATWEVLRAHIGEASQAARIAHRLAARGVPELVTRKAAAEILRRAYRDARRAFAPLVLVECTAGAGKTHAAVEDAAAHAAEGWCTAILAPTHHVAREILGMLAERGVDAHHLVSVGSHEVNGVRSCAYHEAATTFAAAGVSVRATLCDGRGLGERRAGQRALPVVQPATRDAPCDRRAECPAYAAASAEIPEDVRVVVGVHQHARDAHEWLVKRDPFAASRGLLVVDEAPLLLDTARWSGDELVRHARRVHSAVAPWERWRAEVLAAVAHGLRHAPDSRTVGEVLAAGLASQGVPEADAHAQVSAWTERSRVDDSGRERASLAPAPARAVVQRARRAGASAVEADAGAIRACALVARALVAEVQQRADDAGPPRVRVSVAVRDHGVDAGAHELRVCAVVEGMADALRDDRCGRVVLDATGDARLLRPFVPALDPRTIAVEDPCDVTRVFIPWSHGTRRYILTTSGTVRWDAVAGPFREALAVALAKVPDGASIALLSYKAVTRELRRAWEDPENAHPKAVEILEVLRSRSITPRWGHYLNLRGRNAWSGVDAVVCLGTPYSNVAEVQQRAEAYELSHAVRDLTRLSAENELEQAVARGLRGLRDRPVTLVVLAAELPRRADARWTVRALAVGRPAKAAGDELVTLAERLGIAGAAQAAGVSTRTVQRARAAGGSPPGGVTQSASGTTPPSVSAPDCVTPPRGGEGGRVTGCASCPLPLVPRGGVGLLNRAPGVVSTLIHAPSGPPRRAGGARGVM